MLEFMNKNKKVFIIIGVVLVLSIIGAILNSIDDKENGNEASSQTSILDSSDNDVDLSSETPDVLEDSSDLETTESSIIDDSSIELYIKYGELLDLYHNESENSVVIKAKITPSYSNKTTISQNYFNVADFIKNQGGNTYDSIDYWAVADMTDGDEQKVIAFVLDKSTIDSIYDEKIPDNSIGEYANDLFIHSSLAD